MLVQQGTRVPPSVAGTMFGMREYGWELQRRQGHHHLDHFWVYTPITACPFQGAKNAFEAAKFTPFDDVVGKRGIVVDNREQTEGVREKTDKAPQKGVEDFS